MALRIKMKLLPLSSEVVLFITEKVNYWRDLYFLYVFFLSLNSSFIEISFTDHTIYLLKVHDSVGFRIFRVVQPSLQSNSGRFSLSPKETPYPMQSLPIPPALGSH